MTWWTTLTTVAHDDPHIRRRGHLLAIVLLAMIALAVIVFPVTLLGLRTTTALDVVCIVMFAGALALVRRGAVTGAGWLFIGTLCLVIVASIAAGGSFMTLFFLVLGVITAGLVLPTAQIWGVLALCLGSVVVAALLRPEAMGEVANQVMLIIAALIPAAAAVLAFLGAQAVNEALDAAEANAQLAAAAQSRAEEQARDLAAQAEALQRAEQQLHSLVATLETPTVAVAEGVLLAPLIGAIDSRRAQALTERLLREIAARRAHLVILDIAGVTVIDTAVAQTLLQVVRAVRLLGCRVVLTGVATAVALTLTHLGIDLGGVETARSPQEVLSRPEVAQRA